MRLHKLLAEQGMASRRTIESWIEAGKIQVNGINATLGQKVSLTDRIHVAGKAIELKATAPVLPRVIMYHKPEGEICSREPLGPNRSVFWSLPPLETSRWVMVGRLDLNTAGLLLFTDCGELAHRLMHPSFEHDRQYAVRVLGSVTDTIIARFKRGVALEQGICRFKDIVEREKSEGANRWFTVTLGEGKYREVRQMFEAQQCTVNRLIRIKFGSIALPVSLRKGKWQEFPADRVRSLMTSVDLIVPAAAPEPTKERPKQDAKRTRVKTHTSKPVSASSGKTVARKSPRGSSLNFPEKRR